MKRFPLCLILALALSVPLFARAQDPMDEPPPGEPPPEMMPPDEEAPPPGEPALEPGDDHGPDRSGAMVERWLERLRAKNPQEFERMQKLRQEDPEAFSRALHSRLREERAMAGLREFPKLQEFIRSLPPSERQQILHKMAGQEGPGGPHGFPPKMNPQIRDLERETMALSKKYRDSTDGAEKETIRAELKTKLGVLFDLREKDRQAHVERIEKDLANLRQGLTDRQSRREEIIERRLAELTDGDDLRW
jgi:hypothetical protein